MTAWLLVTLKLAVGALILAIGMGSTFSDLTYLWRRPGLLLRSLLAMYVLVPLAALALVHFVPLAPGVKAALLVLAVSAGAPLLPRKLGAFGNDAYVFSLVVTSSLLAIVLVPAWVGLLASYFGIATEFSWTDAAAVIAKAFLAPLAIGMAVRALAPHFSERFADRLLAIAGIVLTVTALILLVEGWQLFLGVHWQGMATLVGLMVIALAIGHVLGGPGPDDRTALAIACATRHVGIAVLVATAFPGPRTAVLVAAYVVASAALSIPYLQWRRRRARADSERVARTSR
jgi:bile acid:Na+ symporter, BASS family